MFGFPGRSFLAVADLCMFLESSRGILVCCQNYADPGGQIVDSDHYTAAKHAQACSINCLRQKKYAQSLVGAQFYCSTKEEFGYLQCA